MSSHRLLTCTMAALVIGTISSVSFAAPAFSGGSPSDVTVPQSALDSLIGEPDQHFHQAANLYIKGDASGAASAIKAAAALIRMEAARGAAEDAAKLKNTAANLDTTAEDVINGNLASRRDLEIAFARADLALAGHYRAMADGALAAKDRGAAARWLKAAGDSVDEAASWTGQSPSGAQAEAWDQMHALQAKIRTSANWSYDEARKGVGYLGSQIQYLGQQMQNFGVPEANSTPTTTP